LGDELKVEKERYRTPEAILDGPPNGFELQDRPNCITLLLARSYGDEDIFVEVGRVRLCRAQDYRPPIVNGEQALHHIKLLVL
jgi:hypothetical protein